MVASSERYPTGAAGVERRQPKSRDVYAGENALWPGWRALTSRYMAAAQLTRRGEVTMWAGRADCLEGTTLTSRASC